VAPGHKAAEVLDSCELVTWPEDVNVRRVLGRLLPASRRDRRALAAWTATVSPRRGARTFAEGDRPPPAHARGRARHRLRRAEGVGARERLGARHVPLGQVANLRKSMS
jgi:hypothetical protein